MTAKTDEPLSIIRQLELMRDLQRLANERAQAETRVQAALDNGLRAALQQRDAIVNGAEARSPWVAPTGLRLPPLSREGQTPANETPSKTRVGVRSGE